MIIIKQAKPDDWVDISLLLQEFHAEIYDNIPAMLEKYSKMKTILYHMNQYNQGNETPCVVFLAYDGNDLIGMASGTVSTHRWGVTKWGEEEYWYVKKKYRNGSYNVGIKLYNKLMKWFKKFGAEKIRMTHFAHADKIGDFYKKKGFVPYETAYVMNVREET